MLTIYWISAIFSLIVTIRVSYNKELYEQFEKESGVFNPLWILIVISFTPVVNTYLVIGDIFYFFQLIYKTIIKFINKDKKQVLV